MSLNPYQNLIQYLDPSLEMSAEQKASCAVLLRMARSKDPQEAALKLSALKHLDISGFPESKKVTMDAQFISFLPELTEINVNYQPLNDYSPLFKKENLKVLHCKGLNLGNANEWTALKFLETLILDENNIDSIEPLSTLHNLKILSLNRNKLNQLKGIEELKNLEDLSFGENHISNLKPLENLFGLKKLFAAKNMIEELSSLQKLKKLSAVNLAENSISNVLPLEDLREIAFLNLRYNRIRSVKPLRDLANLRELSLLGNPVDEEDFDLFPRSLKID
ncbi:MAG: hypothetical protein K2X39_05865 [Silvanigrellaceae bacterium]|nr:hypothetical protein [Silvanigrellaceae bacterium]